jgi:hypothetical protein
MHAGTTSHEQRMLQTHPRGFAFDEAVRLIAAKAKA